MKAEKIYDDVELVCWTQIRTVIRDVNPTLFNLIEDLDPVDQFSFFKIRYPFGTKIVSDGLLQIPVKKNKFLSIQDPHLSQLVKEKLNYCPIPLSLLLNKESEIFAESGKRIIPLQYLSKGQFFGLFEALSPYPYNPADPKPIWRVAAGARLLFMLPKISDAFHHKKLKKEFQLQSDPPENLPDHWKIFGEIVNHPDQHSEWYSEILVFSNEWFKPQPNNVAWLKFRNYLLEMAWLESQMLREKSTFGLLWETLSSVTLKNFRAKPYFIETLKHLMLIATGSRPGFCIANDNDLAAPMGLIEKAYLGVYLLEKYRPILMQPKRFTLMSGQEPVFYSLAHPTVLHHDHDLEKMHRTLPELREIKRVLDVLEKRIGSEQTTLTSMLKNINYAYFHSENDIYSEILSTRDLENQHDWLASKYPDKEFPLSAHFLRGLIKISYNNDVKL